MNIADDLVNAFNEGYNQGKIDAVKHGQWISDTGPQYAGYTGEKCSICGCEVDIGGNYCPNCGAKMDDNPELLGGC